MQKGKGKRSIAAFCNKPHCYRNSRGYSQLVTPKNRLKSCDELTVHFDGCVNRYHIQVVCWLPVQSHAGQGHAGLVNGVKPTAPQTVTLPGEVRLVADANCVSSTPLANGITLPGEVRLVADANCVSSTPLANGITLPGEVGVVAAVNGVSSTPRRSVRSCVWSNVG